MRTRLTGWTLGAVLLLVVGVQAQVQENTAIMLRGTNLLPSNAAGVISNALSLGPFSTNTNLVITNIDGLQTALDGKLATNGVLPSYTNVVGLQPWATNTNTPVFVNGYGTVLNLGAITFPVLRTSEESVVLGSGAYSGSGGAAVGSGASTYSGGAAVGSGAGTYSGGAVGSGAGAESGGAVGSGAYSGSGGAVGSGASAESGGAVGSGAYSGSGGAVGYGAESYDGDFMIGNGFAGGYNAKAKGENRVQLGTGTNSTDGTMQFLSFPLVKADGKIPVERFPTNGASYPIITTGTNSAPTNTATPAAWISVTIGGTNYQLPIYQ